MGPTWVLSAPDGPHVGPMNLAIRVVFDIVLFPNLKYRFSSSLLGNETPGELFVSCLLMYSDGKDTYNVTNFQTLEWLSSYCDFWGKYVFNVREKG